MAYHTLRTTLTLAAVLVAVTVSGNLFAADFAPAKTLTASTDPTAVVSGDLNADTVPDLVVANFGSGSISVMLGKGDSLGGFNAATNITVGTGATTTKPAAVAIGDVVGVAPATAPDGIPDIVVAVFGENLVAVLPGNGDGTFGAATNYTTTDGIGTGPKSLVLGDVDADTDLDIIAANFNSADITVLLNSGANTFAKATNSPFIAGNKPFAVTFADATGDGIPDITCTNFLANTITVLKGSNNANFVAVTGSPFPAGAGPDGLSIGSLNSNTDSFPDLAVANSTDGSVSVFLGDGAGGFALKADTLTGTDARSIAIIDVDNDTQVDLVVVHAGSNNVSVLPGDGSGIFLAASIVNFPAGTAPTSLAINDFDGDTLPDIAVANEGGASTSASLLINDKQPTPLDDLLLKIINNATNVPLDVLVNDTDPDAGDTLTVTAVSTPVPSGSATSNVTNVLYTPTATNATESFTYTVADQFGYTQTANVTVIMAANQAPSFTSAAVTAATQDIAYTYNITATAPEAGDALTITATTKPAWLTLTDNGNGTATLSGTPINADVTGTNTVDLLVTDSGPGLLTGPQMFTIAVANVNDAPTDIALDVAAVDENSANNTVVGNLTTTDPDAGDSFTYSLVSPSNGAGGRFKVVGNQIQVANGSLLNFEANTSHTISVRTTDSGSSTFDKNFTVTVNNVNEVPVPTAPAISTNEDVPGTSQIAPNDPDTGSAFTYSVTAQGSKGTATVSASGLVTYTPSLNLNGSDSVTVTVTDNGSPNLSAPVTIPVTIVPVNDPPIPSGTISAQSGTEGTAFGPLNVTGNFIDPDSTRTYSITAGLPTGTGLTINSTSGVIGGTPTDADAKATQPISVTVSASDGSFQATQQFNLSIADINNVPAFTSTAVTSATQGVAYSYSITSNDPDAGDTLTITAGTLPAWLTLTDNGNGTATLSGTPANADVGNVSVDLTVTDNGTGNLTGTQSFTLNVANVNDAPTVTSGGIILFQESSDTVQVNVSDPDVGDTFTYAVTRQSTTGGNGATVDANGLVTYDAIGATAGTDSIEVTVTDQAGAGIAVPVTIAVTVNTTGETDSNGDGVTDAQAIALELNPNAVNGDTDGDGIPDANEIGDPANPTDSDSDGVINALEAGATASDAAIASGVPLDNGDAVTISSNGQALTGVVTGTATNGPAGINFPLGTIGYTTTTTNPGDTVTVRLTFSAALPSNMKLYKVDNSGAFTELPTSVWTLVNSTTVDVTLTDGDPATDLDGIADGSIDDPLAVGSPAPSSSGGGGGCTLTNSGDQAKDPLMPMLMLTAVVWLSRRKRPGCKAR
ncbi:MAG TPA: tandem-95 repeat protein [Gammaproteobacteria bacterium]|nr:tandem-95 repeat protein [Gammaproteobacteria bacterium]